MRPLGFAVAHRRDLRCAPSSSGFRLRGRIPRAALLQRDRCMEYRYERGRTLALPASRVHLQRLHGTESVQSAHRGISCKPLLLLIVIAYQECCLRYILSTAKGAPEDRFWARKCSTEKPQLYCLLRAKAQCAISAHAYRGLRCKSRRCPLRQQQPQRDSPTSHQRSRKRSMRPTR